MSEPALEVVIQQHVLALMALHAKSHYTQPVHGILVGQVSGAKAVATNAFPVCHEVPTRFLIEMSVANVLSILEESNDESEIIGWYSVPEVVARSRPTNISLRAACSLANLDTTSGLPIFVVLKNNDLWRDIDKAQSAENQNLVEAYGRDIGQQLTNKLKVTMLEQRRAIETCANLSEDVKLMDLVDHWGGLEKTPWISAADLKK